MKKSFIKEKTGKKFLRFSVIIENEITGGAGSKG